MTTAWNAPAEEADVDSSSNHHLQQQESVTDDSTKCPANNHDPGHSHSVQDDGLVLQDEDEIDDNHNHNEHSTNERLLCTAFVSFLSFALLQMVFAIIAGSTAMMGDSAAMIVDAMTYLFNWIAERRKRRLDDYVGQREQEYNNNNNNNASTSATPAAAATTTTTTIASIGIADFNTARCRRKLELQLEILPPIVSVTVPIIVLSFVLNQSIEVLVTELHASRRHQRNLQKTPDLKLMIIFSVLNLLLDFLNVFCFARARHLLGFDVVDYDEVIDQDDEDVNKSALAAAADIVHPHHHAGREELTEQQPDCEQGGSTTRESLSSTGYPSRENDEDMTTNNSTPDQFEPEIVVGQVDALDTSSQQGDIDDDDKRAAAAGALALTPAARHRSANLNMCSAYTHVFADTLRSLAIIFAAVVAEVDPTVTPERADATAAVIVSALIFVSLIPLLRGLTRSLWELRSIMVDERAEAAALRSRTTAVAT